MYKAALGVFLLMSLTGASTPNVSGLAGRWRTQMHGALVDIKSCPDRSPCAVLVWVDQAILQGITQDVRNPDPAKRSRPLVGLPIIWGLRPSAKGWDGGRVYNPETGQTFRSSMRSLADGTLRVTGCWGPLCRSEIWSRADSAR